MRKPTRLSSQSGYTCLDNPEMGQPVRRRGQQPSTAIHLAKLRKTRLLKQLGRRQEIAHRNE